MKLIRLSKKAFTIVELVIVIAVIAVLASVLIPTFSNIVSKANQSKAMQEAKNAWNDVSYYYVSGYKGFAADNGEMNGWYFDYKDNVAKYCIDEKYTVTYNGEQFTVLAYDGSDLKYPNITSAKSAEFTFSVKPQALTMSYYTDIYSRGFSYVTNKRVTETKLYISESNLGELATFDQPAIDGTYHVTKNGYSHKAVVTNLKSNTVYSYKIGGNNEWKYGVFKVGSHDQTKITVLQFSDAQTKTPEKLYKWENTVAQAIETAGHKLDTVLFNGDQANTGQFQPGLTNGFDIRYAMAKETISDYIGSVPYMASMGNHEGNSYYNKTIHYYNNAISFGKLAESEDPTAEACYFSYDYGKAHFVVLNSNAVNNKQVEWLEKDLKNSSSTWKIVMLHNGPHSTGDNSNASTSKLIVVNFVPLFSKYHVDLVLQAHDHTYSKTLPYKWDNSKGYTTNYNDENVVNFNVQTATYNGINYDLNPNGTYYVTTGAAGHRIGEEEGDAGIYADIASGTKTSEAKSLDTNGSFLNNVNNPYKIELGKLNYTNSYKPFSYNEKGYNYNHLQVFTKGNLASGNINAQMFGLLEIEDSFLSYKFYTVDGDNVNLFDNLNIAKN